MATRVSGLIFTPELFGVNPVTGRPMVSSLSIEMEPSVGILARKVDKLGLDIRSFKEPLTRAVKQVMIPSIRQNFIQQGRPDRWQRLADATVARKGFKDILIHTGELYKQMGYQKIWHIDREKALIPDLPEKVWYGKVHQAGAEGISQTFTVKNVGLSASSSYDVGGFETSGEIPQRRFVMLHPEDEDAIEQIFDEWLGERIMKAGLGTPMQSKRGPA